MKTITAQPIWIDGVLKQATVLYSQVNFDNLKDNAEFIFTLYEQVDVNIVPLVNGKINMGGIDYSTYNNSSDANAYAWTWVATTLNITITGEYVPPITPAEQAQIDSQM